MPQAVCQLVILLFKVTSNHKGLTAGH